MGISKKILLISLLIIGCSETKTSNSDDIFFAVDKSLLNPAFEDTLLGISFCPPAGWNALTDDALQETRQRLKNSSSVTDKLSFELIQFFADSGSTAFCSVTEVISADTLQTLSALSELYQKSLDSKFPDLEIKHGEFTVKGLKISQFLVQPENKILFKLVSVLPNQKIVQIDYAIARTIYPNFIKHIESSIGSINTSL